MFASRSTPFLRVVALVLAVMMLLSSVTAVSAAYQQEQEQDDFELDAQFLEEERRFLEQDIEELEAEINARLDIIPELEAELEQVEQELRQLEDEQGREDAFGLRARFLEEERRFLEGAIQELEEELDARVDVIEQLEAELEQVERQLQEVQDGEDQLQAEEVSVRELIRGAEDFEGQRVQVTGDLTDTLLPHAFALADGGRQVIVLAAPQEVRDEGDEQVTVVGPVYRFTLTELLAALGIEVSGPMVDMLGETNQLTVIAAERVMSGEEP